MGCCEKICCSFFFTIFIGLIFSAVSADDRCKDDNFCRVYCMSTNPDTVNARCGRDLASCICINPDNHSVKVRFIEERSPVPPTESTTSPPATSLNHGVHYVSSQSAEQPIPSSQYNYNGNGNSIASSPHNYQQQQQQTQQQQSPLTPVLLECDASEISTRMCHSFCTIEIRAWYGMCNITSKACVCFGMQLSATQDEPIAAIFHSTAPVTQAPYIATTTTTTPKPTYSPPRPGYQQFYPPQQYLHQQPQQQQQQWRPIQTQPQPTTYQYNNNQYYPASSPTILNAAAAQNNQHQEQGPVRSATSLFGTNGQPLSSSIATPDFAAAHVTALKNSFLVSSGEGELSAEHSPSSGEGNLGNGASSAEKTTRRRRSINETNVKGKGKDSTTGKDVSMQGECSKYKCAISCKRNNYFAPDCEPKCIDGQCWCECFPRL